MRKGFGLAIKNWRAKSGISQEELAWRAGLHRSYVADIERGSRNASLQSIEKLAKAFRVSLSTLFAPLNCGEHGKDLAVASVEARRGVEVVLVASSQREAKVILEMFRHGRLSNRIQVLTALEVARQGFTSRHGQKTAELMLVDVGPSKTRTLAVLRAIKGEPASRHFRVVVLVAAGNVRGAQEAIRAGADATLTKPANFARFAEVTADLGFSWTFDAPAGELRTRRHSQNA